MSIRRKRPGTYEYFEGVNGRWYWRYRARNGRTTSDGGGGYSTSSNVKRAIRRDQERTGREAHLVEHVTR